MNCQYSNVIKGISFIRVLSTVPLLHRKLLSTGMTHDGCGAHDSNIRNMYILIYVLLFMSRQMETAKVNCEHR